MCQSDPRPPCKNTAASPLPVKDPQKASEKFEKPRHVDGKPGELVCPAGTVQSKSAVANTQCISDGLAAQQLKNWDKFFNFLGWIGGLAGLVALLPGFQWVAPLAVIASAASTIYKCVRGGDKLPGCILGIVFAAIPVVGKSLSVGLKDRIEKWVTEAIDAATRALGVTANGTSVADIGWMYD